MTNYNKPFYSDSVIIGIIQSFPTQSEYYFRSSYILFSRVIIYISVKILHTTSLVFETNVFLIVVLYSVMLDGKIEI